MVGRSRPIGLVVAILGVSACASAPPGGSPALRGVQGPVEWEITDIGRIDSADGRRSRWSYVVVLREQAGSPIQFEQVEHSAHQERIETGGAARRVPFDRRLGARSELRYPATDTWGWTSSSAPFGGTAGLPTLRILWSFVGKDAAGGPVVVQAWVPLHRGLGRPSRQPSRVPAPLPPGHSLRPDDLPRLAGFWNGFIELDAYHVPVEAIVFADGSADVGLNDPVTRRFRAALSVRDARVWYSGGGESGGLMYHEDQKSQVLMGTLLRPSSGDGAPVEIPLWLERRASP
jgi:hypothetical protein